jgi:uncharacterized protein
MQFDLEKSSGIVIRSFEAGKLRVNNQTYTTPVILTRDEVIADWSLPDFAELSIADFRLALDMNPEVILFGTGQVQRFPAIPLMTEIMRAGIGIEVMDTAAACRTFNVLVGERRNVVAALIID